MPVPNKLRTISSLIRPGSPTSYLVAAVLVTGAAALRVLVGGVVEGAQFITLFPAVMLTAVLAGVSAGVFAVALATLTA